MAAAPRYEDLNMAALLNLPATKIDWLVEGMFPAYGNVSLLAGQPKAGKSTVARSLAVAVAQGNLWLGRQVKQGPVYHLCLEDRPIAVKRHLKRLGVRETDPYTIRFGGVPAGEEAYSWLREKIKEVRPALIVIDTLIHFFRLQDTSSYGEVFTKNPTPRRHRHADGNAYSAGTPREQGPAGRPAFAGRAPWQSTVLWHGRDLAECTKNGQRPPTDLDAATGRQGPGTDSPYHAPAHRPG